MRHTLALATAAVVAGLPIAAAIAVSSDDNQGVEQILPAETSTAAPGSNAEPATSAPGPAPPTSAAPVPVPVPGGGDDDQHEDDDREDD